MFVNVVSGVVSTFLHLCLKVVWLCIRTMRSDEGLTGLGLWSTVMVQITDGIKRRVFV